MIVPAAQRTRKRHSNDMQKRRTGHKAVRCHLLHLRNVTFVLLAQAARSREGAGVVQVSARRRGTAIIGLAALWFIISFEHIDCMRERLPCGEPVCAMHSTEDASPDGGEGEKEACVVMAQQRQSAPLSPEQKQQIIRRRRVPLPPRLVPLSFPVFSSPRFTLRQCNTRTLPLLPTQISVRRHPKLPLRCLRSFGCLLCHPPCVAPLRFSIPVLLTRVSPPRHSSPSPSLRCFPSSLVCRVPPSPVSVFARSVSSPPLSLPFSIFLCKRCDFFCVLCLSTCQKPPPSSLTLYS